MSAVLVLSEITSEREEVLRALQAEGFAVVAAQSATDAVRELWAGTFIVAVIPTLLTGTTSTALKQQLAQLAPEIEVVVHNKQEELSRLVRKVCAIRDGVAAA